MLGSIRRPCIRPTADSRPGHPANIVLQNHVLRVVCGNHSRKLQSIQVVSRKPSPCVSTVPHPSGRRMMRRKARRGRGVLTPQSHVLDLEQPLDPGPDMAESKHSGLRLVENARHSRGAGNPLIDIVQIVSEEGRCLCCRPIMLAARVGSHVGSAFARPEEMWAGRASPA